MANQLTLVTALLQSVFHPTLPSFTRKKNVAVKIICTSNGIASRRASIDGWPGLFRQYIYKWK